MAVGHGVSVRTLAPIDLSDEPSNPPQLAFGLKDVFQHIDQVQRHLYTCSAQAYPRGHVYTKVSPSRRLAENLAYQACHKNEPVGTACNVDCGPLAY